MTSENQMKNARGKKPKATSLLQPTPLVILGHPFGETLEQWRTGVPVNCGAAWSMEAIDAAVARGPHITALLDEAIAVVHEDIAYQVKAGFSEVMYWDELQDSLPPQFKISPVAVVPQVGRRGRIILDLSFPVYVSKPGSRRKGEVIQEAVNMTTEELAPKAAVKEIGKVLQALFEFMSNTPANKAILFSKIDLSDGFWRMIVDRDQRWNFCYVMPDPPGSRVRIVVPSALQMGWKESPPYFCAATETGRDFIQWLVDTNAEFPPHPFEHFLLPEVPQPTQTTSKPTSLQTDDDLLPDGDHLLPDGDHIIRVYVDDYILGVIENLERTLVRRIARAALYGIHSIFPPPQITGHEGGKDPISEKKLAKGDARFLDNKIILGFLFNGTYRTVQLPPDKANGIITEIQRQLKKNRIPLKRFLTIVGRIMNAARILPSAKALTTPLYRAMKGSPKMVGLGKDSEARLTMADLRTLIQSLAARPTHVHELVRRTHSAAGTADASSEGAGGIWFGDVFPPTVWRVNWPPEVKSRYKAGVLTNSDLEMAAIVLMMLVLEGLTERTRQHTLIFSDNTPAVSWTGRLVSSKAESRVAARLLRILAIRGRVTQAAMPTPDHWPGEKNEPADTASRSVETFNAGPYKGWPTKADASFLTLFARTYVLPPQTGLWQLAALCPEPLSLMISTLLGARLLMPQWMFPPVHGPGGSGPSIVKIMVSPTHSCPPKRTPKDSMSWWLSLPGAVQAYGGVGTRSRPTPSRLLSDISARPLNWADIPIPATAAPAAAPTSTLLSPASTTATEPQTLPPNRKWPSR
jgi:hypothetical protein